MPLFVGIILGLASCAQQGANLPEFPHYRPADDFLERQHGLASFPRSRPQPDAHGKRNEEISRDLERQLRLSNAKSLELRARQREEALLRRRIASQRDFAGLQAYLARSASLQAEIARGEERESRVDFERVQDRLARLRRAREEALVRRRIASQRDFAALQAQLARTEAEQAEVSRGEEREFRRDFERVQDRLLGRQRAE